MILIGLVMFIAVLMVLAVPRIRRTLTPADVRRAESPAAPAQER
jgi:hypothetical protein